MKIRKWTEEQFIQAVKESLTIAEVLKRLGLRPVGGNYATVRNHVKRLDLDTSHWRGQGWSKGRKLQGHPRLHIDQILVEDSPFTSTYHLKHRLLKNHYLENQCAQCGLTDWLDKPISLHLEHRNGNRRDNRLENLCLLCPNCHSQTDTYCGRNLGSY